LLAGPAVFGLLLVTFDSYTVSWATFAVLAALVAVAILLTGPAIDRVRPA
jgi:cyanate permease